jgi:hypothetical protein
LPKFESSKKKIFRRQTEKSSGVEPSYLSSIYNIVKGNLLFSFYVRQEGIIEEVFDEVDPFLEDDLDVRDGQGPRLLTETPH